MCKHRPAVILVILLLTYFVAQGRATGEKSQYSERGGKNSL